MGWGEPSGPPRTDAAADEATTEPASASVDLLADGVLWAINATLFHPRGFALAVDADGALTIQGDGSEVWMYDGAIWSDIDARFQAFERLLDRHRPT